MTAPVPIPAPQALAQNARGIAIMLAGILFFTLMDALARHLMRAGYDPMQVVWARYTGQFVFVMIVVARHLPGILRTRHPVAQGIRSILQFAATSLFFLGLAHIGLAEATAIMDVNPVLITLGAALFLGERIGPRRLAGILVALAGALIVIRPGAGVFSAAALFPLGAAACYAGFALITRWIGGRDGIWTSLAYAALVGTVATSAMQPFVWRPVAAGELWGFLLIGGLGVAGQLCILRAFTIAEAGVVAPFAYVGLVFATLWGFVFFAELPDRWTVAGAALIVAAGLYVWYRETRLARRGGPDRPA